LGESYHSSGRHIAATKAILNAQKLEEGTEADISGDTWFTKYMLANIKRELGDFDEAIDLYQAVMKTHTLEEGVILALMQTMVENALTSIEKGHFGKAVQLAGDSIHVAADRLPPYAGGQEGDWHGLQSYVVFIVRDDRPCDFLFQCSDTTWAAYNRWPDLWSLYDDGTPPHNWYTGPGVAVSFDLHANLDFEDEIVASTCIAHEGEIRDEATREALEKSSEESEAS
jgi:hypothetical protein